VGEAIRGVLRHKLRSALSVLGITIGIAAVVLVVAIGQAGSALAQAQLHALADNLVWVEAGPRNVNGVRMGSLSTTTLTYDDAEAILHEVPLIKSASPQIDGNVQVIYGNRNWGTRYRGVTPEYLEIKRWVVANGASFSTLEAQDGDHVCVIGQTVREQLFGDADPVGEMIRINGWVFRVVGL